MAVIVRALEPLDSPAQGRVLQWAHHRFTFDDAGMTRILADFAKVVAKKQAELAEREAQVTGAGDEDQGAASTKSSGSHGDVDSDPQNSSDRPNVDIAGYSCGVGGGI